MTNDYLIFVGDAQERFQEQVLSPVPGQKQIVYWDGSAWSLVSLTELFAAVSMPNARFKADGTFQLKDTPGGGYRTPSANGGELPLGAMET